MKAKDSIMINEIVNEDIKKTAKSAESTEEAVETVNIQGKIIKISKCNILCLAYQQGETFERFKANASFINMVKEFERYKSVMLFKILIVKFVNKYQSMKKS